MLICCKVFTALPRETSVIQLHLPFASMCNWAVCHGIDATGRPHISFGVSHSSIECTQLAIALSNFRNKSLAR